MDREGYRALQWSELQPGDWNPLRNVGPLPLSGWSDADPRAQAALAKLKSSWDQAPVVATLDGTRARLSGFVVTLQRDSRDRLTEFLLVPSFGACIHAPPPPPNQTILVDASAFPTAFRSMDAVTIRGALHVHGTETEMGRSGYTLTAVDVEELPLAPTDGRSRQGRETLAIAAVVCTVLPALILVVFVHRLQKKHDALPKRGPAKTRSESHKRAGKRKR